MKLNGTRLEKRSPRKKTKFQTRNGGQKTNLQLTIKWRVNEKTTARKKEASKIFSTKKPLGLALLFGFTWAYVNKTCPYLQGRKTLLLGTPELRDTKEKENSTT